MEPLLSIFLSVLAASIISIAWMGYGRARQVSRFLEITREALMSDKLGEDDEIDLQLGEDIRFRYRKHRANYSSGKKSNKK